MIRLVRAEWTKLFTTRVWLGLLLGACVMAGGFAALFTGLAGQQQNGQDGIPPVGTQQYETIIFSVPAQTTTFLTEPRRGHVITAKLIAYALVAVPFALVIVIVDVLVVTIYAGARGAAPSFSADNLQTLAASGLVLVVFAVIGVGVGALFRNQVGAIVGSLVYLNVVEPIVAGIGVLQGAYKWLPGGAAQAITTNFQAPDLLEPWQGGLLLVGYGLLAAVLGTFLAVRRDVV
jgi:hypothetical protein